MDKKNAVILAGTGLTLAVLGMSLYEVMKHDVEQHDALLSAARAQAKTVAMESRPMTAQETVSVLLPSLGSEDEMQRRGVLEQLSAAYDDPSAKDISGATRESLASSLISLFEKTDASAPEGAETREEIIGLVVGRVGGEAAREFTLELLGSSSQTVKLSAAKALTVSGAVRGTEVAQKAVEFARSEGVPDALKPALLRRFLGRKAEPEITALFEGELSPGALKACAVELQNFGKPELMGKILARLEGAGLLADQRKMPWLSGKLLSAHIKGASKDELTRAIDVIKARPALTRATVKALKERLSDKEPTVRKMVAGLIPGAVDQKGLESEEGQDMLVAQLQHEEDPVVKGVIEEGLSRMRLARQPQPASAEAPAGQ